MTVQTGRFLEIGMTQHRQYLIPTPEKIKRAKPNPLSRLTAAVGAYRAVRLICTRLATLIDDTAIEIRAGNTASLEQIATVIGIEPQALATRMTRRSDELAEARAALAAREKAVARVAA